MIIHIISSPDSSLTYSMNISYEAGKYVAHKHVGIMNLNWF